MSYTKSGSLFCPCCGTKITVTNEDGRLVATTRQVINSYDDDAYKFPDGFEPKFYPDDGHRFEFAAKEEEGPTGNLRPDSVPKGIHAPKGSKSAVGSKFDRNSYQRQLMRKRRAEARKPKGIE